MHDWSKESLHLAVGDWIIWQDAEIKSEDGFAIVSLGMKGQVISLHGMMVFTWIWSREAVFLPRHWFGLRMG